MADRRYGSAAVQRAVRAAGLPPSLIPEDCAPRAPRPAARGGGLRLEVRGGDHPCGRLEVEGWPGAEVLDVALERDYPAGRVRIVAEARIDRENDR